jgi:tRNA(adenine34) deaminase
MRQALKEARRALDFDEVPVGAVVVVDGKVVGRGFNRSISKCDPTAHAEIMALRQAARKIGNYRLTGATLYCTLEPCGMCAASLVWARIKLLVYAAADLKAGAVDSRMHLLKEPFWNHRIEVTSGILEHEARCLLQGFFKTKREIKKAGKTR